MEEEEMLDCAAAMTGVLAVIVADKRNWPGPKLNMLTVRSSEWEMIRTNEVFSIAWFNRQLRCARSTFEEICRHVAGRWTSVVPPLGANAEVDLTTRVAITLSYIAHGEVRVRSALREVPNQRLWHDLQYSMGLRFRQPERHH